MVYLMERKACAMQYFWLSFMFTFAFGALQGGLGPTLWVLGFGLSLVVLTHEFPDFDWGMTNTLSKFLAAKAGKGGDNPMTLDEFLSKFLLQFLGSFVASLIWDEIGAGELFSPYQTSSLGVAAPTLNPVFYPIDPASTPPKGEYKYAEIFVTFAIWHMIALYVFNKLNTSTNDFTTNWRVASCYMFTIFMMNSTYIFSFGGLSFDGGRWLAGIMKYESDDYETKTWWCLFLGPITGYLMCIGFNMLEAMVGGDSASGGDSAAPTEEASPADNA